MKSLAHYIQEKLLINSLQEKLVIKKSNQYNYFPETRKELKEGSKDEYIDKKAKEGIRLSYMNSIYAALVKIIGERPSLNRFAMNGSLYARNQIFVFSEYIEIFLSN